MQMKKPPFYIKTSKENHHFIPSGPQKPQSKIACDPQGATLNLAMSNDAGSRYLARWISFESQLRKGGQKEQPSVVQESREEKSSAGSANETISASQKGKEKGKLSHRSRSLSNSVENGKSNSVVGLMKKPKEEMKKDERPAKKKSKEKKKGLFFIDKNVGKPFKFRVNGEKSSKLSNQDKSSRTAKSKNGSGLLRPNNPKSKNTSKNGSKRDNSKMKKEPNGLSKVENFLRKCLDRGIISGADFALLVTEYTSQGNSNKVSKDLLEKVKGITLKQRAALQKKSMQSSFVLKENKGGLSNRSKGDMGKSFYGKSTSREYVKCMKPPCEENILDFNDA